MKSSPERLPLVVVAAAIVTDRRLLLVSKQQAPNVFYLPGGKPEPGEAHEACLVREIAEELAASVAIDRRLGVFSAVAALEAIPMAMTVYLATLDREPRLAGEIAALEWFGPSSPFPGVLAPAVRDSVVPALVAADLLQVGPEKQRQASASALMPLVSSGDTVVDGG